MSTGLGSWLWGTFQDEPIERLVQEMVCYAQIARDRGLRGLRQTLPAIQDRFTAQGVQKILEGADAQFIEQTMTEELDNLLERLESRKAIFEWMNKYAPACGMLATLVSLVVILRNIGNPSAISPVMAVVVLGVLFAVLLVNLTILPWADRQAQHAAEEILSKTIVIQGVLAIRNGEHPKAVEQQLRALLPPASRKYGVQVREQAA